MRLFFYFIVREITDLQRELVVTGGQGNNGLVVVIRELVEAGAPLRGRPPAPTYLACDPCFMLF